MHPQNAIKKSGLESFVMNQILKEMRKKRDAEASKKGKGSDDAVN